MLGRCLDHSTQQLAVARLELILPAQRDPRLGDAVGERVANALELVEAGQARTAPGHRGNVSVDLDPRKGLRDEASEPALQAPDLPAQLGTSEALVATYDESLIADSKPTDSLCWCLSLTQTRHPRRV